MFLINYGMYFILSAIMPTKSVTGVNDQSVKVIS